MSAIVFIFMAFGTAVQIKAGICAKFVFTIVWTFATWGTFFVWISANLTNVSFRSILANIQDKMRTFVTCASNKGRSTPDDLGVMVNHCPFSLWTSAVLEMLFLSGPQMDASIPRHFVSPSEVLPTGGSDNSR